MSIVCLLIVILLLGFFLVAHAQKASDYSFLFRNTIVSQNGKYELGAVLRGRIYYPRYFYIPVSKQYLVYSEVDESGEYRYPDSKNMSDGKRYALLNEAGHGIITFDMRLRFSSRSGCFYGPKFYVPFLEAGKTDTIPYDRIYNEKLRLDDKGFADMFTELYKSANYIEFVNLRTAYDDTYEAGVVFRKKDKVEILLSGVRDSRMIRLVKENKISNDFDDYYEPDVANRSNYSQSPPSIELIPLETKDTNPFVHWRKRFTGEFRIKKYINEYSSGWYGLGRFLGIPVYVPGEKSGTVYVKFRVHNDIFKLKILDVEKAPYMAVYNLGLRTFKLPLNIVAEAPLIFMESAQNSGSHNRFGGGVFVVRPGSGATPLADIPEDMTEQHFNSLPLSLQEALQNPDSTTELIIESRNTTRWMPELERFKNLKRLTLNTSMSEIPDEIAALTKLEALEIRNGKIQRISNEIAKLKELKELNLFSNNLKEFPGILLELKSLQWLDLGANELISSLPENINTLKKLKYLSIMMTNITTLPPSMVAMKNLYVENSSDLQKKMPEEYWHLFDYTKQ